ncbi:MAG: hypothetical protein CMP58_04140 [Flavobacteriales bacterium]|nr:hypothetical protein [Flavobacteriales bacterium]
MSQYTIDQFSKITGLNKLVIRTWENRYNFLKPRRSKTNIRFYDNDMLSKGIKYSILVEQGYKISKLIKIQEEDLNKLIEETLHSDKNQSRRNTIYTSKLVESAIFFNQNLFEETYNNCVKEMDIIEFYKNIIIPTMSKIGILYLNSKITPANEHFLSENLRNKIALETEKIINKKQEKKNKWILFLPENEYHDIGLLFAKLLLKKNNKEVIYLGQNVPRESLKSPKFEKVKIMFFVNARKTNDYVEELCSYLRNEFKKSCIYMVYNNENKINNKYDIKEIINIDDFIEILK